VANLLAIRWWERPDRTQPVYKGVLDLWEAPLYVPIGVAERESVRTPARQSDRTYLQQTGPSFGWIGFAADQAVQKWIPAFDAQLASERSRAGACLDVRRTDVLPPAWIFTSIPVVTVTVAQQWPAIHQATEASYRSAERARLDVRKYEWAPEPGWIGKATDTVVAKWAPVFLAELGYRSGARMSLDVRQATDRPQIGWWSPTLPVVTTPFFRRMIQRAVGGRSDEDL
jgi:hypothetical protein